MNDADGRGGCATSRLEIEKADLRRSARMLRKQMNPADRARFAAAVCDRLIEAGDLHGVVSGFWAVGSEIDVTPTLRHTTAQGGRAALPVIVARHRALAFREWAPGRPMLRLGWLYEPPAAADLLVPSLILTPLLAFDRRGRRLGQGGGYYDRTLADLRARGPVTAIGVAFGVQEVDEIPADQRDAPLDAVVTEREWIKCG